MEFKEYSSNGAVPSQSVSLQAIIMIWVPISTCYIDYSHFQISTTGLICEAINLEAIQGFRLQF